MKKSTLVSLVILGLGGILSQCKPEPKPKEEWDDDKQEVVTKQTHVSPVPWWMFWRWHSTPRVNNTKSMPTRGGFGTKGSKSSSSS